MLTASDIITHDGIAQPIMEWALDYGIPARVIIARLNKGWSPRRAIEAIWSPRPAKVIEHDGDRLTAKEWAERRGISAAVIKRRIGDGWSTGEALGFHPRTAPQKHDFRTVTYNYAGKRQTLEDWSRDTGISMTALRQRLKRGWPSDRVFGEPQKQFRGAQRSPRRRVPAAPREVVL